MQRSSDIMVKHGKLRKSKYGGSAGVKIRYSQGYHQRVAQVNHTLSSTARRREETERKHREELAGMQCALPLDFSLLTSSSSHFC